jgi:hypothetical protein
MKAVLAAFRAPLSDGSAVRELGLTEFSAFWKSLDKDYQETLRVEALAMGFTG